MKSADHIWTELRAQPERPVFRRVDDTHPFDIYIGIDAKETPALMLLSSHQTDRLPHLKSLEVSQTVRHDGRFALLVTLSNPDLFHPFRYVCDDLIESLRTFTRHGGEGAFLIHRIEKWRRLLEGSKRGLSKSELMGLVGELLFLERLIGMVGSIAAVDGWLGPSGAPQDFQSGGQLYEIKACAIGSHEVTISSLKQLHTGQTPASLIVFSIGSSPGDKQGAFTPNELVNRIRALLEGSTAASTFELKLAEVGLDEHQPECDSALLVETIRAFCLRESFPRLTPASVPPAISAATYCLDLDQCAAFEVSISEVFNEP